MLVRDMLVSSCSLAGGAVSQAYIEIPVLGYMIGSFVGSMVGSFVYSCGYNAIISFCVDSGFTFFGLVEQDYTLPEEVLKEMGVHIFEYEKFDYSQFEPDRFEPVKFEADRVAIPEFGVTFLRRGVIGISQIGYTYQDKYQLNQSSLYVSSI